MHGMKFAQLIERSICRRGWNIIFCYSSIEEFFKLACFSLSSPWQMRFDDESVKKWKEAEEEEGHEDGVKKARRSGGKKREDG